MPGESNGCLAVGPGYTE